MYSAHTKGTPEAPSLGDERLGHWTLQDTYYIRPHYKDRQSQQLHLIHRNKHRDAVKMCRQRNMAQMKEQRKTPQELNKMWRSIYQMQSSHQNNKKNSISSLWDNFKRPNIQLIGLPEEDKEQKIGNLFEKIMKEKVPNLVKVTDMQVQEAQSPTPDGFKEAHSKIHHN